LIALLCLAALSFIHGTVVKNLVAVGAIALCIGGLALTKVFRPALVVMAVFLVAHAVAAPFLYWGAGDVAEWFQITLIATRKTLLLGVIFAAAYALRNADYKPFFELAVPMACVATLCGNPLLPFNASLNAAILVAGFAVVPGYVSFLLVAVVTILQSGVTAPFMLTTWAILQGPKHWLPWPIAILMLLVASSAERIVSKASRFEMYGLTWEHFIQKMNIFVGGGLDSFLILGPKIQKAATLDAGPGDWTMLHSSWLQIPVELGVFGLALAVWLYVDAVRQSGKRERDALILLGVCAVGYFPGQVPLFLALGIWLVVRAESRDTIAGCNSVKRNPR
jgi:hypothetical protein